MRKYGFDKFSFTILAKTDSHEELDELEIQYIQQYHALTSDNGYNIELGGNSAGKHSEETKRKMSLSQRGELNHMYGRTGAANPVSKPILDLTTGKRYDTVTEASLDLNLSISHIASVARGQRGSTGRHVFRYLDSNDCIIQPSNYVKIKSPVTLKNVLFEYRDRVS